MTENEVREAIAIADKEIQELLGLRNNTEFEVIHGQRTANMIVALQTLISVCQSVLNAKVPVELSPETRIATPLCEISFNKGRIVEHNLALSDFRFTDNSDGTVSDSLKKCTWVKRPHTDLPEKFKGEMNFAGRKAACKGLSFAGKTGWRQPNRDELESMRDFSRSNPAVNTDIFPDIKPAWYGTGEEIQDHSEYAWCVYFSGGNVNYTHKGNYSYVWPVRSSQCTFDYLPVR